MSRKNVNDDAVTGVSIEKFHHNNKSRYYDGFSVDRAHCYSIP